MYSGAGERAGSAELQIARARLVKTLCPGNHRADGVGGALDGNGRRSAADGQRQSPSRARDQCPVVFRGRVQVVEHQGPDGARPVQGDGGICAQT